VFGIVVVDDGVAEVQLEAAAKVRIGGAAGQLLERVVLQRIQPAESDQTVWKLCDLFAGPVIVAFELLCGVVSVSRRLLEDVRRGQDDCAFDAGRVELLDQVGGGSRLHRGHRRRRRHECRKLGAEQVLMVVGERHRRPRVAAFLLAA
jgi:hypothetical protein